ncbi:hypothetical protein BKA69DRAFT_752384 [Paraphysoderma sedebokerense]|nr:hypothetical protein BKA69DRAFT_885259 [Paraphysoderma sedebokerense]KAI9138677.1 hypothetical protein BKA69DRAFT_752384 [Paraphysoderma sedebokerense]
MYAMGDTASMYSVYQSSTSSSPKPTTHGFVASGGSFIQSNMDKNATSSLPASDTSQTQMPVDYLQQNGQEGWHGYGQAVPEPSYTQIDSTARSGQSNKTQAAATPLVSSKYDSYITYSNASMNSPVSATPSMNDVTPTQQMFSNSPPVMAAPIQRPSSTPPQSAVFATSNPPGYTNYSTSSVPLTTRSTRTLSQSSQPISAPPQRPSSTPPQSNRSPSSPLSQSFVPSGPNIAANVTSVGSAAIYSSQPIISPHQRPSSTPPQSNIMPSPPFGQSFIAPSNENINGTSIGPSVSVPSLQSVPQHRPSSTPPVTSAGIVGSGARRYQTFVPPTSSVPTSSMPMSTDLTSQNAMVSGYYQGSPSTFSQPQQDFSTFASYNNQDLANSPTSNIPTPTQSVPTPTPLAPTRSNSAPPTNVYASLPVRKRSISTPSPLKNLTTLNESTEFGDGVGTNIGLSSNQNPVQGGATPNIGSAEYNYAYGVASTTHTGVASNSSAPIPVPNQDHSYNYQPQSQYQTSQILSYSSNGAEGTYASSPASSSFSVDSEATYKPRNTGGNGTGSIYSDRSVTPTPSFSKNSGYENQSPIIKCQTCGVELASFSRFCNLCGTPVPSGTQISSSQISPVRDNKTGGTTGAHSATSGTYQSMPLSNTTGQASAYYDPNANVDLNTGYYQNAYNYQQQDPGFMGQVYNQAGFDQNNSMPLYTSTAEYSSYQQPNQNQYSEYNTPQPVSSSSQQVPTHRGPSHPSERLPEHQPARIPILNFTATGKVVVMFPKATFRYSSSPGINKSGDGISSNQNGTLKVYPGEIAIKAVQNIVGITDGGFGVSQKELDILRRIKEWSNVGPLISCGDVTAKQKEKESYIESKKKAILDILKVWEAQNDAEIQVLMDRYQVENPQSFSQNDQVGSSSPDQTSDQGELVCCQDRKILLLWLKSIVSNISASFVANPSTSNVKKLAGSFGLHKRGGSFNALDWLSSGGAGSNHKKSGSIDSTNSSISVNSNGIASAEKEEKARSNDELMVELLLNMVKPLLIPSNSTSSPPPSSTTTPYLTSTMVPSETIISASLSSSSHGSTTTNSVGGLSRDLFMMYQFLVMGKRIEAVKFANEKGLYPHALLIASCVSKDVWVETVKRFTRSLGDESASASENDLNELGKGISDGSYTHMRKCCLRMIYQLFAPVGKDAGMFAFFAFCFTHNALIQIYSRRSIPIP